MDKRIENIKNWQILKKIAIGHGTRDKILLRRTKLAKVYFFVKSYNKDIEELRSEVCASNIGRTCGFSVQRARFCIIPQYKKLGFKYKYGVLIQLDITRQRDKRSKRSKWKEDLIHGMDLISSVKPEFSSLRGESERRRIYTLNLVLESIRNYIRKNPKASIVWQQFFELVVFDALIGGTDRHYRNWGVLVNVEKRKQEFIKLTPAFDNGISLLWKMSLATRNLNFKSVKAAPSAFRRAQGGQYKLFELCEVLMEIPEINNNDQIVKSVLEKIDAITNRKLKKAILNMTPENDFFDTNKKTLRYVYEYVKMRLQILKEILHKKYDGTTTL